jgi:phosphatidylglycerophosphatase C
LKKTIAFFDFDGTITFRDTMLELIRFHCGTMAYYRGMAVLSPVLIGMKLGLVAKDRAKEKLLAYFFGGLPLTDFTALCERFIRQRLPGLLRPDAVQKIGYHLSQGHRVVVVSASAENWIGDWCRNKGLDCIATRLAVVDDRITGQLSGANCNGIEKVNRIRSAYSPDNFAEVYAYGDTDGDKPMLALATHPFFRVFTGKQ